MLTATPHPAQEPAVAITLSPADAYTLHFGDFLADKAAPYVGPMSEEFQIRFKTACHEAFSNALLWGILDLKNRPTDAIVFDEARRRLTNPAFVNKNLTVFLYFLPNLIEVHLMHDGTEFELAQHLAANKAPHRGLNLIAQLATEFTSQNHGRHLILRFALET